MCAGLANRLTWDFPQQRLSLTRVSIPLPVQTMEWMDSPTAVQSESRYLTKGQLYPLSRLTP